MYWSSDSFIYGAELDGANRQIIASLRRYKHLGVQAIALDVDMNRIYITGSHYGAAQSLSYIDLNISNPSVETLAFWFPYDPVHYGIAVDDQYVYFTKTHFYGTGMVYRRNKTKGGGHLSILVMGLDYPRGVTVQRGNTTRKSECTYFLRLGPFHTKAS